MGLIECFLYTMITVKNSNHRISIVEVLNIMILDGEEGRGGDKGF